MRLPESQLAVVEAASATDPTAVDRLADETDLDPAAVTRAAFDLREEDLVTVDERIETDAELTDEARDYLDDGLPEVRLYRAAIEAGADDEPVSMGQLIGASDLGGPQVDIALSNFARKGYGSIDSGEVAADPDADPDSDPEAAAIEALSAGESVDDTDLLDQLERRELVEQSERTVREVTLTDKAVTALMEGIEAAETVDRLTPEMLTSGEWAEVEFAEYNVEADAPAVEGGRKHILRQTADRVKDVLVGMGFQEMEGPHADADFWINDCLFMPQDHPARTHWDRFALDVPGIQELPDQLVDRVESAHREGVGEDGEGYHSPWSRDFAEAVALRGHTTSLSMRYLSGFAGANVEPPQRYFSVEKVYRNDTLDPTHLLEFFQIEGWVLAEDLSVRDLMGTFEEFYKQFGIEDIQFKPHYNPYTEPSFELFGTHPTTGELVEIGNSGMFRPEVLEPLGIEADVMAWGLALERLLMLMYGFEDIRDVHGTLCDLELLRETEVVY
ncbi:phenylalanine--tRNA ligase subunit alpha [Halohasta salina]|uniref:phenylalanine--tRNA ligase subunit alpha n=1 Tax=Halohasta salina TaxID=2961621 RepID=UPI0020A5D6BC|nr:phenylalanine--tRNA ligase subunit alpha [Halohasta salina]